MHPDTSLIEMALCCALCGTLSGSNAPEETFNFFHGEQKNSFVETCIFWLLNWEKNLSALVTTEEVRICGLSVIIKILRRDERWKKNISSLFPCMYFHVICICIRTAFLMIHSDFTCGSDQRTRMKTEMKAHLRRSNSTSSTRKSLVSTSFWICCSSSSSFCRSSLDLSLSGIARKKTTSGLCPTLATLSNIHKQ